MKRLSIFTVIAIFILSLIIITCDNKPTELTQNNLQTEPLSLKKTALDLSPHAYNSIKYITGKCKASDGNGIS